MHYKFPKDSNTYLDTIVVDKDVLSDWKLPAFQRPLRVNAKLLEVVEEIKQTETIPGIIHIGVLNDQGYKLDGQHRLEAFKMSSVKEAFANVCFTRFEDMASMGVEFVRLNGQISRLRPDDVLKGLEGTSSALKHLRKECPFVGYDQIRRNDRAPILSMSMALRCWYGSAGDTPTSAAPAAVVIAKSFTDDDAELLSSYLSLCERAWGREDSYSRLWKGLNLTLCAWLYRRTVLEPSATSTKLNRDNLKQCLMALSADPDYLDWLSGRTMNDRDRVSGYNRIKNIWSKRLQRELGKKIIRLPQPPWAPHS